MNLYLSNDSPLNSTYTQELNGYHQVLYKVDTTKSTGIGRSRTSAIRRIVPNDSGRDGAAALGDQNLQDKFEVLGEVQHNFKLSSVMRYGGQEIETQTYFRDQGFGAYDHNRAFTGPDGREYIYHLESSKCKLFLNDGSNTPILNFHRKRFGFIGKARPARLEIFQEGMHILEFIFVTFIYMEKFRGDREGTSW